MSSIFAWQGPTDQNDSGEPQFYANNLVAGGNLQQKSNAALYKNTRAAARKLNRAPVTAQSQPTLSLQSRTIDGVTSPGADGNPNSKATDELKIAAVGASGGITPDFSNEAGDLGGAG